MARDGTDPRGPSEAELQQILAQMREAPAEQVLVEVINVLLQAVQVKLGRPDARLLLDTVAAITESVRGRAEPQLVDQVAAALTQLRLAQVDAEGAGTPGASADDGPPATAASPAAPPAAGPAGTSADGAGSRLWVPGR